MIITRDMIVQDAMEWLNTPFGHQGRSKKCVDCAGVIECLAINRGLVPEGYERVLDYAREPDEQMSQFLNKYLNKRSKIQCLPATILFFGFTRNRRGQHLGIMIKENIFIHSYAKVGKVIESRLDNRWKKRLIAAYDFKGIK